MNAANVMAISPKAGTAGKAQLTRIVSKTSAGNAKDSFGEVLDKAGEEVTGKMAKSPVESQGSIQGNVNAKEADIKDDMPEGTDAALLDKQQGKEPQAGIATRDGQDVQGAKATDGTEETVEEQDLGKLAAQAAVLNFSTEGQAVLVMEEVPQQAEPAATMNLQSLLPQSTEDAQKNKNFLAMLSGQQVKITGKENAAESAPQDVVKPQPTKPATMLEVQLNNHQLANQATAAVEGHEPLVMVGSTRNSYFVNNASAGQFNVQAQDLAAVTNKAVEMVGVQEQDVASIPVVRQDGNFVSVKTVEIANVQGQDTASIPVARQDSNVVSVKTVEMPPNIPEKDIAVMPSARQDVAAIPVARQDSNFVNVKIAELPNIQEQVNIMEEPDVPIAAVPNNGRERFDAKGMAPFEQREATMPSMPAGRVNDSVTLENIGRVIVPEEAVTQLQPRRNEEGQLLKNPLAGVSITVEEEVPAANPTMNMQQNPQPDLYQQQRPPMPMTETVSVEDGETVNQLAEEAVGDKAPTSAGNEPVSMFQQSLNESLTGTRGADDVNLPQDVQDDFNVPRQIVEQARLLRRGEDTQMVIKLHPDHLGELTLKVSVSANGAVNASFHSDNAQVRAIIENSLVQLKQELSNQGLKVDNVDVYAGLTDGQLPQGEGQQAWQQNQGNNGNSNIRGMGNVEEYGEETEVIAVSQQSATDAADGVDYRI